MAVPGLRQATHQRHLGRDKFKTRAFGDSRPCKSLAWSCPVCKAHSASVLWHLIQSRVPGARPTWV